MEKQNKEIKQTMKSVNLSSEFYAIPTNKSKVISGRDYILWGDDNNFDGYIDSLKQQSEHGAILKSKIEWIALGGVVLDDIPAQQAKWLEENDIDDFIYKITKDLETYGGFSFYVIRSRDGQSIASVEYQPFKEVRFANDPNEGEEFLIGEDWSKYRTQVETVPAYKENSTDPKSLYYYNGISDDYYPEPPYFEGLHAIETLLRLDKFHLNLVKNGFFIPTVISFRNGIPEDEQQDYITQDIKNAFTGEENAGELLVLFNEPDQEPVQIDTMETTNLDEKFQSIMEAKEQDIFTSHKVTSPMLFGIKTEGQLGGRTEMIDAWELFKRTYIIPHQNIITGVLNSLLSQNWSDVNIRLELIPPIEAEIDETLLTIEEKRKMYGLEDSEITDQQRTIMNMAQMPQELRSVFVNSLSVEQLHELVGYESTKDVVDVDTQPQNMGFDFESVFFNEDVPEELFIKFYDQYVDSSNLLYVEYVEDIEYLFVSFKSGTTYSYTDVPKEVVDNLMSASSKGSYFYYNIRTSYDYQKISG